MSQYILDPFFGITPIYGFSSDSEELAVAELFTLTKYVLWQRAPTNLDGLTQIMSRAFSGGYAGLFASILVLFYSPATNFFRLLRLFKPGRLTTGDTFVLSSMGLPEGLWETLSGQRCSETALDYTLLNLPREPYRLSSSELPFFTIFSKSLLPQLESLRGPQMTNPPAPLEIALGLYNEDDDYEPRIVLNCLTALEALLTNESKTELSYRLSLRVANLLEVDDASRFERFKEMRDFYDLRSEIVHGVSKLTPKLQNRLESTTSLREIVRRTILSVMALRMELGSGLQLDRELDQIVFDEARRKEVQKLAARFLHIEAGPPSVQ